MGINDVAGGMVYCVLNILPEFLGHNFVSSLRRLKPKNFFEKPRFSQPWRWVLLLGVTC